MNKHVPVLIDAIIDAIKPQYNELSNSLWLDTTFGRGGYVSRIRESFKNEIWASDRDPEAISYGKKKFGDDVNFLNCCFSDLLWEINKQKFKDDKEYQKIDFANIPRNKTSDAIDIGNQLPQNVKGAFSVIIADLGVSSPQIDNQHRGFSFQNDGPLDMRMGKASFISKDSITAGDLVNNLGFNSLVKIFKSYGEEKNARFLVKKIIKYREEKPFENCLELAEFIKRNSKYQKIHPATRIFQALRMAVNCELWEIEQLLFHAAYLLRPGGKLFVVSFHSLEDRIIKNFTKVKQENIIKHHPSQFHAVDDDQENGFWSKSKNQIIKPSKSEIMANPRSRSSKLRVITRNETDFNDSLNKSFHNDSNSYEFVYNWLTNLDHDESKFIF